MWSFIISLLGWGEPRWSAEERECFRQVALADPDDPGPRLRLATALERRGDPMGEYIRLTHEADSLPPDDPARGAKEERLAELVGRYGQFWCRPLKRLGLDLSILGHFYPPWWMTNGVLDQLTLDRPGILPQRARQVFEAMPGLRVLKFGAAYDDRWSPEGLRVHVPDYPGIFALPHLAQVGELDLSLVVMTLDDLRAVTESPHLGNLRVLKVQGDFGPAGGRLIAAARSLKRLRVLEMRYSKVGDGGAAALAGSPHLAGLEELQLQGVSVPPFEDGSGYADRIIHAEGAAALATSPHLARLWRLGLEFNQLGAAGVRALATSPYLKVTDLNLGYNQLGAEAVRALASAPWLAGVTSLDLGNNPLGPEAGRHLAGHAGLTALKTLRLNSTDLGDAGLTALAGSFLPSLSTLDVGFNQIGPEGAEALAAAALPGAETVHLSGNPLGDAGVAALARAAWLGTLCELSLASCEVGGAGLTALLASPRLRRLRRLTLFGNVIGEGGVAALLRTPHLTGLDSLSLTQEGLDEGAVGRLTDRFGDAITFV